MNIFLKSAGKQEGEPCVSNMVQLGDFFYLSGKQALEKAFRNKQLQQLIR